MSQKPETKFRNDVVRPWIAENLPDCFVMTIQQIALRGAPDLVLCLNGLFVALELKSDAGDQKRLQKWYENNIVWKGKGRYYLVYPSNWDTIKAILLRLHNQKRKI